MVVMLYMQKAEKTAQQAAQLDQELAESQAQQALLAQLNQVS